jgi:hypothetical protein
VRPTDEELREALAYWQERLRIQDWRIHAYYVVDTLDLESKAGQCHLYPAKRQAVIRLASPQEESDGWEAADPHSFEWKVVLVHELLHVRFSELLPKESTSTTDDVWEPWEPIIHALSMALVKR